MADTKDLKIVISGDSSSAESALQRVGEVAAGLGLERIAEKLLDIGRSAASFAINAGSQFEQWNVAFETMVGDASKAGQLMKNISDFAAKTPFELPQLIEGSKRLLAYNIDAAQIIPTMQMLGDIASGVGMEKLPNLILAFGQVSAATKLTGMELRQFSEAGVPLLGALADKFKVTNEDITEMVSKGQVKFKDVQEALAKMTAEGGKFHNMMQKQSETLGGITSNIRDNFTRIALSIVGFNFDEKINQYVVRVGSLFDNLKKVAQGFLQWMNQNSGNFEKIADIVVEKLGRGIEFLIGYFKSLASFLATTFKPIFDQLFTMYQRHHEIINILAQVIGVILLAAITAIVVIITAFIAVVTLLADAFFSLIEGAGKALGEYLFNLWQAIDSLGKAFENFKNGVVSVWNAITSAIRNAVSDAIGQIDQLIKKIEGIPGVKEVGNLIGSFLHKETGGFASGLTLVGEHGPELVNLPSGSYVNNAPATRGMAGNNISVTINNPSVRSDSDIQEIVKQVKYALGRQAELARLGAL